MVKRKEESDSQEEEGEGTQGAWAQVLAALLKWGKDN